MGRRKRGGVWSSLVLQQCLSAPRGRGDGDDGEWSEGEERRGGGGGRKRGDSLHHCPVSDRSSYGRLTLRSDNFLAGETDRCRALFHGNVRRQFPPCPFDHALQSSRKRQTPTPRI